MATTISNPASFNSIRSAFSAEGYGSSTSFFAYRQGGGIVPSTSAFDVIGAGTSGDPLKISQFNGFVVPSKDAIISLTTQYINSSFPGFQQASAVYGLSSDGYVKQGTYVSPQSFTNVEQWCNPSSLTGNYEALITLYTGSLDFGTVGSWIPLGSGTQYFRITAGSNQIKECTFVVEIRKIGTTTVLASWGVSLYADTTIN